MGRFLLAAAVAAIALVPGMSGHAQDVRSKNFILGEQGLTLPQVLAGLPTTKFGPYGRPDFANEYPRTTIAEIGGYSVTWRPGQNWLVIPFDTGPVRRERQIEIPPLPIQATRPKSGALAETPSR